MNILIVSGVFVLTYYLMSILQAVLHRSFGHKRRIDAVFAGHAIGHHGQYPPSRLRRKRFTASEARAVDYYVIPAVATAGAVYWLFGGLVAAAHVAGIGFAFAWHVYLHRQYHLSETWLERFGWFREKRELHFVHHRNARVNFAVVEFWVDNLMGTRCRG